MPRKPHTCPTCKGRQPAKADCDTCNRTGVVWEPGEPAEAAVTEDGENHLDLSSRPR